MDVKSSDEVLEGKENLYSDDYEYPYADKPKQLIYSRNYVKSERSVATSMLVKTQSSKASENKPDVQMFMFITRGKMTKRNHNLILKLKRCGMSMGT